MEMECLWFGESEKAFFKYEDLEKNRSISKPLYPKEYYEILKDNNFKYEPKKPGEIRLLTCDIAGMSGKENDASVYTVIRLIPRTQGYDRYVVYMESMEGGHTVTQAIRIRQLYDDLDCDYVVLDTQNLGLGVYDQLCLPLPDRDRGIEYDPWSCINDEKMAERCTYKDAEKIIYSIKGSSQLNSEIAVSLRDGLRRGKVKLLCHEIDGRDYLKKLKKFEDLPVEIKTKLEMPYIQTTSLINEMVNLEGERTEQNLIKLKEPKAKRKDRYSSVSYGNYIASLLERNLAKDGDDIDDHIFFIFN